MSKRDKKAEAKAMFGASKKEGPGFMKTVVSIPAATIKKTFDMAKAGFEAVTDNILEKGQDGTRWRLESRKIGQWLGLVGYGATMWFIIGTVHKLLQDPNWLKPDQFSNFIALITVLLGGSAIFSLFYTMKKRNGGQK